MANVENINEYGEFVEKVWFSTPMENGERKGMTERDLAIMALGLCGEAGEVTEKIKKHFRDKPLDREDLLKEIGDVVYYSVRLAQYFGFKPSDILNANIHKLEGRIERGTQRGSGDNR